MKHFSLKMDQRLHPQTQPVRNQHRYATRSQQTEHNNNSIQHQEGTAQVQEGIIQQKVLALHKRRRQPNKSLEPTTNQAMKCSERDERIEAIRKEVHGQLPGQKHSLQPITDKEFEELEDPMLVSTCMKNKIKLKADGSKDKLKSRLNTRGDLVNNLYKQLGQGGEDQPATFAPTISMTIFMLFLQISLIRGMKSGQHDVEQACLPQYRQKTNRSHNNSSYN